MISGISSGTLASWNLPLQHISTPGGQILQRREDKSFLLPKDPVLKKPAHLLFILKLFKRAQVRE